MYWFLTWLTPKLERLALRRFPFTLATIAMWTGALATGLLAESGFLPKWIASIFLIAALFAMIWLPLLGYVTVVHNKMYPPHLLETNDYYRGARDFLSAGAVLLAVAATIVAVLIFFRFWAG